MTVLASSYSLDESILWDNIIHSHTPHDKSGYLRRVAKLKSCTFSLKSLQNCRHTYTQQHTALTDTHTHSVNNLLPSW